MDNYIKAINLENYQKAQKYVMELLKSKNSFTPEELKQTSINYESAISELLTVIQIIIGDENIPINLQ